MEAVESLIDLVRSFDLDHGFENSLISKLENVIKSLEKGKDRTAINQLAAFINQINAQCGKKLTEEQADQLVEMASRIIETIQTDLGKIVNEENMEGLHTNPPSGFVLYQNYPNPFNPTTTIEYTLPRASFVSLKIYDLHGRELRALVQEQQAAGSHSVVFHAVGLSSNIYFYKLEGEGVCEIRKMVLMR